LEDDIHQRREEWNRQKEATVLIINFVVVIHIGAIEDEKPCALHERDDHFFATFDRNTLLKTTTPSSTPALPSNFSIRVVHVTGAPGSPSCVNEMSLAQD
jgi:hypothetical protein